ncbi:ricin-type beta-trefoil lectin domain protein [Sorangium sp. So ce590]|uniref:ricin-type beta-trefoil lectin domain protein n=1 Tax=Sorangium sp. So ce590 TaxID=3133317 RepID=UPI003F641802
MSSSKQPKSPSRWQRAAARSLLLIGLLGPGGLAAGCYASDDAAPGDESGEAAGALTLPAGSQFHDLYMVAHEDDDLLFMSPDVRESIRAGHTVRTVYLTAGDAGDTSAYWKDGREAGIRAAYALMAGVANRWTASVDTVNGKPTYRFTLDGNGRVSVVFLRLPDGGGGDGFASPSGDTDCNRPGYKSLRNLWNDTTGASTVPVLGTWGSCAGTTYTKSELGAVLRSLVQGFAPTRMHIQDLSDLYGGDHSDHVHAAKFAFNAHHAYAPEHQLVVHRDYNIANEEENLSAQQKADKTDVFCTYAAHDTHIGDCSTYGDGAHGSWLGSQYQSAQITVADGWLAGLSDKCLDLPGGKTTNGTTLQIRDCAGVPNQRWTLKGGKIQLTGTDKCVDLRGADTTNGTPVQIWDCVDVPNQKWTLTSDGMLRGLDGKCLDVRGANPANGTVVQVWDCVAQPASGGGLEVVPQQSWTPRFGAVTGWTSGGLLSDGDASGLYGAFSYYYGSVRLGDVNGDHLADVCGRRPDGVYCALNQGGAGFGAPALYTAEFSDARGWATEMHGMTLMLGDVDHDGRADVCGRGGAGILCATANATGTAFVPDFRAWTPSFSNATEFAAGAQYYGSLRLVDVDGDGYADVCGRGAGGIQCAINDQRRAFRPAATWLGTEYLDALGWSVERHGMTLAFGDINGDGRADVCGRGAAKIICATGKAGGGGFEDPRRWSLRSDFADTGTPTGWDASRAYYGSIRLGDINGDGYADVCGRSPTGLVCGLSSGSGFDRVRPVLPQDYTNAAGWGLDRHGMTLELADLDGDGALDVCGRGAAAILCAHAR